MLVALVSITFINVQKHVKKTHYASTCFLETKMGVGIQFVSYGQNAIIWQVQVGINTTLIEM